MSTRTTPVDDRLHDYLCRASLREPPVLAELRAETAKLPDGRMQISPEQGQFMALLAEMLGARRALEIGVFTGYSSISVARAMGPGGRLVALDVSEEWTAIARKYWQKAGVASQIELRLGPAVKSLDALLASGARGSFDFAFIDADKVSTDAYYERALELLRPGGLVAVDNAFKGGDVADPECKTPDAVAMRAVIEKVTRDERVTSSLVPISDGLLLARKR